MPDPRSEEEARQWIKAGLDKVYFDLAMKCSAPLMWFTMGTGEQPELVNGGTAFFVDAGCGAFAITARHVLEFREMTGKRNLFSRLASLPMDPCERIIAKDPINDIATFAVSEEELGDIDKMAHSPACAWPPSPPQQGKGIFFGGYRRLDRTRFGNGSFEWGFAGALTVAGEVSNNRITAEFERTYEVEEHDLRTPERSESWGGASGGPVFSVISGPIDTWRIAAVVAEQLPSDDFFVFHGLSTIKADGKIEGDS